MTYKFYNVLLIIIAIFISLTLNQDRIIRPFYNDTYKHAVPISSSRTTLGDTYHYYIAANQSIKSGLIAKQNVNTPNNVLLGSLAASGIINFLCTHLIQTSDLSVLLSLILQTFLLVLAISYVIKNVGQFQINSIFEIGFWTITTLVLSEFFLLNSFIGTFQYRPLLSFFPNILRPVNPQMGWSFGLLYFSLLFTFTSNKSFLQFICLSILSFLFFFFSPSLGLTMLLAMLLIGLVDLIKNRAINYYYLIFGVLLFLSFMLNYLELSYFQSSLKGAELGTGVMKGVVFKPHYFIFLLLVFPIIKYYQGSQLIIIISILISSIFIGAFCESINLGSRLWIRGAGVFVWIIFIANLSIFFRNFKFSNSIFAVGTIIISACSFFLLPHQFDNDYSYIKTDKWILLDWINKNVPADSIIMSDDLEFSFLLPIYTSTIPFVPLFSESDLSVKETVQKYFYTLEQYDLKDIIYDTLKNFNAKKNNDNIQLVFSGKQLPDKDYILSVFYDYIIYYPYTKFSIDAFKSKDQTNKFMATLNQWSNEKYMGEKRVDYMIVAVNQNPKLEPNSKIVFNSNNYILYSSMK